MNVELYVYDLSNGFARQFSMALLGRQVDMVYHTSIVMGGVEYVYDSGIKYVTPGKTHLGPPLEVYPLGTTEIPLDVAMDWLESAKEIFTCDAYDLWRHNCNTFSHDFAMFLVGKEIPPHITNLPEVILDTAFGRKLKPMLDKKIRGDKNVQAGLLGIESDESAKKTKPNSSWQNAVAVKLPSNEAELANVLEQAKSSCAIIFFTDQSHDPRRPTPADDPYRELYPVYEQLARQYGKRIEMIKIDINKSEATKKIAAQYSITSTPSFMTWLGTTQTARWTGTDANRLRHAVKSLVECAWPSHLHESLKLDCFHNVDTTKPILYSRVPPMDKLWPKLGKLGKSPAIKSVRTFLEKKHNLGPADADLPDIDTLSTCIRETLKEQSIDVNFAVIDIVRAAMADPRFSGYYAEEKDHLTMRPLFDYIVSKQNQDSAAKATVAKEAGATAYALRLVALQLGCNLFSSPLFPGHILEEVILAQPLITIIAASLLDRTGPAIRIAASSLAFNIASANSRRRQGDMKDTLSEDLQIELAASLLEAIRAEEESGEALKGYLAALGHLVYMAPASGDLLSTCRILEADRIVLAKKKQFPLEKLINEIGGVLLAKGLPECHKD